MVRINLRQQKFVNAYIKLGSATKAMEQAGYKTKWPGKYSSELLAKPHIQALLEKTRNNINGASKLTIEYKLNTLHEGIAHYIDSGDYDKASKLIEVANKMQGHNAPEKSTTTHRVTVAHEQALLELE